MKIQQLENYHLEIYDVKDQLKRLIYNRSDEAFAKGDIDRDEIESKEQLEVRQAWIREKFIEAIGGLPPSDNPLNAKITGTLYGSGFRIEKIIFESRPDTFVTSNLYIPDGISAPRGAVLFLCGHHKEAKHVEEYQIVCQYLAQAGLVVLAIDPIGQGERFSYYERELNGSAIPYGTGEHDYAGSQCWPLGDSLARYFTHDAMRAVDYLCTRPEVDPGKIGVTGNSGGGTQTSLMMVCDPRIAAAMPVTFLMNRQTYMYAGGAQDSEQIWPGMSALGFDHEDILLSMVPRPVLAAAVKYDFFPIEGTRRTIARTGRFWEMYGKQDCIHLVEDDTVHSYSKPFARAAAEFFSKHLNGQSVLPSDDKIKPIIPDQLWCTATGQVRGEYANARAVFDENSDRLREFEAKRSAVSLDRLKENGLAWMREKVFAARKPCEQNPRHQMLNGRLEELALQNSIWWSQEGMLNHALRFKDYRFTDKVLPLTVAVWDGGSSCLKPHLEWIRETCSAGRAVMVLDVSGAGPLTPHPLNNKDPLEFYEIIHKLTDDLIWLNDSLAAMRTYDVLRALDMAETLRDIDRDDIRIYACGRHGLYGQLAAVLDQRVKKIDIVNGIGSFAAFIKARYYDSHDIMSLIIPGMLQYFDLPDTADWN